MKLYIIATRMNYCKKLLLLLFVAVYGTASMAQNTDRLDFVVRHITRKPAVRHASLAVCVHNINKDSTVYTRNEDLAMLPGAVNKLFTTAAAYSRLGPKFTFETYLYYTGSNGRENDQSSGIGLYLVKTVLDDLGHKIEIESEAGKGTVVSIVF